jgi:nucleoside-diphosphate-sugar epimerase
MKIVVVGGSGLIGRKLVDRLCQHGDEAIAASPASGVDTITEIICLPPVATKMTGVSSSRRLQRGLHFPPVRARDDPRRRGVPAKTGRLRGEATGGEAGS